MLDNDCNAFAFSGLSCIFTILRTCHRHNDVQVEEVAERKKPLNSLASRSAINKAALA
jgi:hypothetical protein